MNLTAATWWSRFGDHCSDLQKLAIRILSQTCNGAEVYGLRRDVAEKLLSSAKNVTENQKLHNLTYLHYNLKLKQFKMGLKFNIVNDEIDPSEDWIVDKSYQTEVDVSERMHLAWPETVSGSTSLISMLKEKGSSGVPPKVEPKSLYR